MSWWTWALLGWVVLSLPAGILVGRVIRKGQRRDRVRQRMEVIDPLGPPLPRDGREDRSA